MRVAHTLAEADPAPDGRVLAIGNFDGVHLGHRTIIGAAVAHGIKLGLPVTVLTFDPHPVTVVRPSHLHHTLTTFEDRAEQFADLGVSQTLCLKFDKRFAQQAPEAFVDHFIVPLNVRAIFVGSGYKFGHHQSGHTDTLTALGKNHGFDVFPQSTFSLDGQRVSSSRVRQSLLQGDVALAATLLGRPYCLKGVVVPGAARGRKLGYRTANLNIPEELVPENGVYAARVTVWDKGGPDVSHDSPHRAIVYIGTRPSFPEAGRLIEVHLLNKQLELYDHRIRIDFIERVRGEMTFADAAALKCQIDKDVAHAEQVLG